MATVDAIQSGLIDKILTISDEELLKTIDKLISSGVSDSDILNLS